MATSQRMAEDDEDSACIEEHLRTDKSSAQMSKAMYPNFRSSALSSSKTRKQKGSRDSKILGVLNSCSSALERIQQPTRHRERTIERTTGDSIEVSPKHIDSLNLSLLYQAVSRVNTFMAELVK